jgi:hypothetical protein
MPVVAVVEVEAMVVEVRSDEEGGLARSRRPTDPRSQNPLVRCCLRRDLES